MNGIGTTFLLLLLLPLLLDAIDDDDEYICDAFRLLSVSHTHTWCLGRGNKHT